MRHGTFYASAERGVGDGVEGAELVKSAVENLCRPMRVLKKRTARGSTGRIGASQAVCQIVDTQDYELSPLNSAQTKVAG
jgi:hypothetical protein